MWRRALLAAAAVSYLICVLIMSGMQKEDLDVSMLGKLQRYNVNLDDINNERIRRQCATRHNEILKGKNKEIKEAYVSTTEYKPIISTKDPLPSENFNMDAVINYLKTQEDSSRNLNNITKKKTSSTSPEVITEVAEHIKNQPKINNDSLRRFIELESQKKLLYKKDADAETAKQDVTINLKTDEKELKADDITIIDTLIKDYIAKKQQASTTTERTTTTFTINLQNIYKRIDEIIANGSNIDNKNVTREPKYPDKAEQRSTEYNTISPVPVTLLNQKIPYLTGKQLFQNFYDFFNDMNQFRNNSSRPMVNNNNNNVYNKETTHADKLLGPVTEKAEENKKNVTTSIAKSEKEPDPKTLTPSLMKDIAETVKNVIIKDLRNELTGIHSITTQTTTTPIISTTIRTTTETLPTTTITRKPEEKDKVIMDKFMDLYEQIKSLKQARYSLTVNNESTPIVNNRQKQNITPSNAIIIPAYNGAQKTAMIMPAYNGEQKSTLVMPAPNGVQFNAMIMPGYNGEQKSAMIMPPYNGLQKGAMILPTYNGEQKSAMSMSANIEGQKSAMIMPIYNGAEKSAMSMPIYNGAEKSAMSMPIYNGAQKSAMSMPIYNGAEKSAMSMPIYNGAEKSAMSMPIYNGAQKSAMSMPANIEGQKSAVIMPIYNRVEKSAMNMPAMYREAIPRPNGLFYSIGNYITKTNQNNNFNVPREARNLLPIMIQTNSAEIQPLAVPVLNPESIIRQNIVVNTPKRQQRRERNNYMHSRLRYIDSERPVNYRNRTYNNYSNLKRYDGYNSARYRNKIQEPRQRDDVIRFRLRENGNSNVDTDYYERINFGNNNNGFNENRGGIYNYRHPRFHERLERGNPGLDRIPTILTDEVDVKNEQNSNYPSRHQLSLIEMKRGSSYNDTHFKNFLSTQQKVTNMLERILATNAKANRPRSVETI